MSGIHTNTETNCLICLASEEDINSVQIKDIILNNFPSKGPIAKFIEKCKKADKYFNIVRIFSVSKSNETSANQIFLKQALKAEFDIDVVVTGFVLDKDGEGSTQEDIASKLFQDVKRVFDFFSDINIGNSGGIKFVCLLNSESEFNAAFKALLCEIERTSSFRSSYFEYIGKGVYKDISLPYSDSMFRLPDLILYDEETLNFLFSGDVSRRPSKFDNIIGQSFEIRAAIRNSELFAASPASINILILGESGTGKELFANAIHGESEQKAGAFVPLNCGAIPENLIESELFGQVKGAYTGAERRIGKVMEANNGTLFLDEIGELPLMAQVKLLRVLNKDGFSMVGDNKIQKSNFRLISATHVNLWEAVQQKKFRADLYYRIAVAVIEIPPLRSRGGDIKLLANRFLEKYAEATAKSKITSKKKSITTRGMRKLLDHDWPGNARELENTLYRALVITPGDTIDANDIDIKRHVTQPTKLVESVAFGLSESNNGVQSDLDKPIADGFNLEEYLDKISRHYIEKAMIATHHNKSMAARMLGFSTGQKFLNWYKRLFKK